MAHAPDIDGVLITWGDRLFYPGNRIVKTRPQPKLGSGAARRHAAAIRRRIEATVVRRAPQVMVKVTGGGRGMRAIAAHFRYISKNGRLEMEDERGETLQGKASVHEMADDWRFGGSLIPDDAAPGHPREAFNIMLSMPRGTDPLTVQRAAREFAREELADHKWVMVLHDHQANPHVHISVRAESKHGKRLNPRKTDLHRWRETFADKLRAYGVECEATRQATRGATRRYPALWQVKAGAEGRLVNVPTMRMRGAAAQATREEAQAAWREIAAALGASGSEDDRKLALSIQSFSADMGQRPLHEPTRMPAQNQAPMQAGRTR